MKQKIIETIQNENKKNPLTDEELGHLLGILRETVTNLRKEAGIPDSRERRKISIFADMKAILEQEPSISERKLTKELTARGYAIGKYAVGGLKAELLSQWQPIKEKQKVKEDDLFRSIIGYNGSMKSQLQRAQAAILYPPKGLHCLLYGPSGVGKSYLAELMYEYALTTDNFSEDAPFFAFNCADYADNPQLLLAQLFGYSKGAFTGAGENKKGIVEQCNGGILFLDEVHRLPPEGQEILFYLMDKGKFRRLGEVEIQRESHLMIIAATTENPQSSLLLTFRRRIPMVLEIPTLNERPLSEKLTFIRRFFRTESRRLKRQILVSPEVIRSFADSDYPGNVGQLKSDIQVCCAKAFLEGKVKGQKEMVIGSEMLPDGIRKTLSNENRKKLFERVPVSEIFSPDQEDSLGDEEQRGRGWDIYRLLEEKYDQLKEQGINEQEIQENLSREIEKSLLRHIQEVEDSELSQEELARIVDENILDMSREIYKLAKQRMPFLRKDIIFPLAIHLNMAGERVKRQERIMETGMVNLKEMYSWEYGLASEILEEIGRKYYMRFNDDEAGFLAMYFHKFSEHQTQDGKINVLVVSHGSVACGMAEVANSIMGIRHAVGLEMGLMESPAEMEEKVVHTVRQMNEGKGCLILADMGSLMDVGKKVTQETGVPVRVVGRTDTLMVIEAVRKTCWTDETLNEIADDLDVKRFVGTAEKKAVKSREKAVLCLCITGEGAARILKDYLNERLKSSLENVQVITRGYIDHADVADLIKKLEETYEILAIVGTLDPQIPSYPFLSVSEIYQQQGLRKLRGILKRRLLQEQNQLREVITPGSIFKHEEDTTKEYILDQAVEYLVQEGNVQPEFLLSVYKREGLMPTFLKGGIAIPHGSTTLVTKPAIHVTKLDIPIVWDGVNMVDLVILLALDENSKKYFEQLYQMISDELLVSRIRNCDSSEEIYKILCGNTETVK